MSFCKLLCVVLLDATAAVDVKGPTAASAAVATEAAASAVALFASDADAEEERRNEEGRPGAPAEAEGVGADVGLAALGLEGVARLDEGCAAHGLLAFLLTSLDEREEGGEGGREGSWRTYVIRETAMVRKKSAEADTRPAMAAPRRPQQARKPANQAMAMKKRAIRYMTQPKRHR